MPSLRDSLGFFLLSPDSRPGLTYVAAARLLIKSLAYHCFSRQASKVVWRDSIVIQRTRLVAFVVSVLCVFCCGLFAQSSTSISLQERVMMASRIYHVVSTFFPGLSQDKFDAAYEKYLSTILRTEDRRAFDLASMEFVADLHDGHTWFYDKWLDQNHGAPIGILAYPVSGKWTVVRSQLDSIHVGDVIASVDDASADEWFVRNRRYLSASSDRDASVSFFDTPALFPGQFTITLGDGRKVPIDRKNDKKQPLPAVKTEGKWLVPNSVAYVKVPTFHGIETQAQALEFLKQYHDAKTLILDVRGNPGTGAPGVLQRALMVKPYQDWNEASSEHVAASRLECGAFGRPRDLESGGCGRRADCSNWSGIGGGRTDCPNWSAIGVGGRTPRTECGRGMDGRRRRIGDSVGSWRADSRLNVVVGS